MDHPNLCKQGFSDGQRGTRHALRHCSRQALPLFPAQAAALPFIKEGVILFQDLFDAACIEAVLQLQGKQ